MKTLEGSLSMLKNPAILQYIMKGVLFTLIISVVAVSFGILIGSVLALVRNYCNHGRNRIFRWIATVYIEIFRNILLLLWIFICLVFCPAPKAFNRKLFGLSSSADGKLLFKATVALVLFTSSVMAEIIRGGIMSIDNGQFEAGRSLGFNYIQTMYYIVIPQALKNVLPALANEFIVLLKETSVSGYVAVRDLTKGGDIIRGATYSAFMPLIAVALIYLVLVMFFSYLVGKLERRLRNSEH